MPPPPDPSILHLTNQPPIAEGTQRTIYRHPTDPTLLIKVLKPLADTAGRSTLATFTERHFPSIRIRWARKEYTEYLRLMLANPQPFHLPISHMYGFTHTDLGLGCITQAVTDGPHLGPTLSKDTPAEDIPLLNDTIQRLYHYNIRAGDMTPRNFVFGHRGDGPRECVLVDGFGDIHAIPIRSLSLWTNAKGLDDSCKRLARKSGLHWDVKNRQFSKT